MMSRLQAEKDIDSVQGAEKVSKEQKKLARSKEQGAVSFAKGKVIVKNVVFCLR